MRRASQCPECGCYGHHLQGCPEGERAWELANPETHSEPETEEPFDAVTEIMAHFISIYGGHEKKAI